MTACKLALVMRVDHTLSSCREGWVCPYGTYSPNLEPHTLNWGMSLTITIFLQTLNQMAFLQTPLQDQIERTLSWERHWIIKIITQHIAACWLEKVVALRSIVVQPPVSHSLDDNAGGRASLVLSVVAALLGESVHGAVGAATTASGAMQPCSEPPCPLHPATPFLLTCIHQEHKGCHYQKSLQSVQWSVFLREGLNGINIFFSQVRTMFDIFCIALRKGWKWEEQKLTFWRGRAVAVPWQETSLGSRTF